MPVMAMPSTNRFCTKKNTMINGNAEINAPAITTPYGVTDDPCPVSMANPAVMVRVSGLTS